ncbi:hypothetical protein FHT44_005176 [Mycolicibacterium sp. BK634]|uniref:hypothetical protein n=1 Tax=Mycolicibacterium sp. BK634 TaxID=2587099 RepID=UPI00161916A3|nr:hypothetical protein [Mycolicibacterium sp. BK634]MBB3752664.1 hypothetical protein [Mycolicibacterium sp. BK634]
MKINSIGRDFIDAEPDHRDGTIYVGLRNAQRIAIVQERVALFEWNGVPFAIAADTDLNLILRQWESRQPGEVDQIGPYPDPETTPEFTHGIMVVNL